VRPIKTRIVRCSSKERYFSPRGVKKVPEAVALSLDGFEAIRLADLEGLTHARAARLMKVSRPTFSRILSGAHLKVAEALVKIAPLHITGGCCERKIL